MPELGTTAQFFGVFYLQHQISHNQCVECSIDANEELVLLHQQRKNGLESMPQEAEE